MIIKQCNDYVAQLSILGIIIFINQSRNTDLSKNPFSLATWTHYWYILNLLPYKIGLQHFSMCNCRECDCCLLLFGFGALGIYERAKWKSINLESINYFTSNAALLPNSSFLRCGWIHKNLSISCENAFI